MIETFDNLYSGKLFIATYSELCNGKYIDKRFKNEHNNLCELIESDKDNADAAAYIVKRRSDNYNGVLIVIYEDIPTSVIAHEAVHVADYFCEFCGITTQDFSQGNEHYAYLVGWAAGCIAKVLTTKKRQEND